MHREKKFPSNVDVKIISAKYGLINANTLIEYYDQRMTTQRANELKPLIQKSLGADFRQNEYTEVYIDLGKDYLITISGVEIPASITQLTAYGRIGERLSRLKEWLTQRASEESLR